jgi:ribosomal-protein-serine acetyltransferase
VALLPDTLDAGAIELCRSDPKFRDGVVEAYDASYAEVHRWLVWAQRDPTPEDFSTFLDEDSARFETDSGWRYIVLEKTSSAVVGWSGIRPTDSVDVVSIGYWVRTDRTRLGYATAASRCLTDAAFTYLSNVDRVQIQMDQTNAASIAIPRALGYRLDRETEFEPLTPGHSGKGFVWVLDRAAWSNTAS